MRTFKCEICGARIGTTILGKIEGTYIKDKKGKKHMICNNCQRKFQSKEEILRTLNIE